MELVFMTLNICALFYSKPSQSRNIQVTANEQKADTENNPKRAENSHSLQLVHLKNESKNRKMKSFLRLSVQ